MKFIVHIVLIAQYDNIGIFYQIFNGLDGMGGLGDKLFIAKKTQAPLQGAKFQ